MPRHERVEGEVVKEIERRFAVGYILYDNTSSIAACHYGKSASVITRTYTTFAYMRSSYTYALCVDDFIASLANFTRGFSVRALRSSSLRDADFTSERLTTRFDSCFLHFLLFLFH